VQMPDCIFLLTLLNEAINSVVRHKQAMPDIYEYQWIISDFRLHLLKVLLADPYVSGEADRSTYYGVQLPDIGSSVSDETRKRIVSFFRTMFKANSFSGNYDAQKYAQLCGIVAEFLHTGPVRTPRSSCKEDTKSLPFARYKPLAVTSYLDMNVWDGNGSTVSACQTVAFRNPKESPGYAFAYIKRFDRHNAADLYWYEENANGYFTKGQRETLSESTWKNALCLVAVNCPRAPVGREQFVIATHIIEYMKDLVGAEAVEELDEEDRTMAIVRYVHPDATLSQGEEISSLVKRRLQGRERRCKRRAPSSDE